MSFFGQSLVTSSTLEAKAEKTCLSTLLLCHNEELLLSKARSGSTHFLSQNCQCLKGWRCLYMGFQCRTEIIFLISQKMLGPAYSRCSLRYARWWWRAEGPYFCCAGTALYCGGSLRFPQPTHYTLVQTLACFLLLTTTAMQRVWGKTLLLDLNRKWI